MQAGQEVPGQYWKHTQVVMTQFFFFADCTILYCSPPSVGLRGSTSPLFAAIGISFP